LHLPAGELAGVVVGAIGKPYGRQRRVGAAPLMVLMMMVVYIVMALAVAAIVGVVAGLGPAIQAASIEPTDALRYE